MIIFLSSSFSLEGKISIYLIIYFEASKYISFRLFSSPTTFTYSANCISPQIPAKCCKPEQVASNNIS